MIVCVCVWLLFVQEQCPLIPFCTSKFGLEKELCVDLILMFYFVVVITYQDCFFPELKGQRRTVLKCEDQNSVSHETPRAGPPPVGTVSFLDRVCCRLVPLR